MKLATKFWRATEFSLRCRIAERYRGTAQENKYYGWAFRGLRGSGNGATALFASPANVEKVVSPDFWAEGDLHVVRAPFVTGDRSAPGPCQPALHVLYVSAKCFRAITTPNLPTPQLCIALHPPSNMADSIPLQVAETISTASIQRNPSPTHDLNPSTAASAKVPVAAKSSNLAESSYTHVDSDSLDVEIDDEEEFPADIVRPLPRRKSLPPLPDLRFEQSYLASLKGADSYWKVAWITVRDQVFMALAQGFFTSLLFAGWKHWNHNAKLSGNSAGARLRRWWWNVNNWKIEKKHMLNDEKLARRAGEVSQVLIFCFEVLVMGCLWGSWKHSCSARRPASLIGRMIRLVHIDALGEHLLASIAPSLLNQSNGS